MQHAGARRTGSSGSTGRRGVLSSVPHGGGGAERRPCSRVPGRRLSAAGVAAVVAVALLTAAGGAGGENRSPRVVTTKYGKLRGAIRSLPGKDLRSVEVFLGVPYATPPTGSNRFSPTRTPDPWKDERLADQYGPVCPQHLPELWGPREEAAMPRPRLLHLRRLANYLTHQAEDCLYLNIYVPSLVADKTGHGALPVVVYIHGESFEWGASNPYDGSVLAAHGHVIVITLNYRLGPLGFLNTNADPSGRGHIMNHGLMDQIAALHWVQENIGAFGGDPGSVTLLGHGTGAACIHFLMASGAVVPGLFQRAVLMSGSAFSPWATVDNPTHYAIKFGRALNCTGNLTLTAETGHRRGPPPKPSNKELDDMVNCLKERPLEDLQAVHISAPQFLYAFGPSVDGIVIKKDYRREMRKRADEGSREYDLLFGVVPHEAFDLFTADDIDRGFDLERRDRIFRTMVRNAYDYHLNEVFISLVNEYTNWEQPDPQPYEIRDATLAALSDALYVAPLLTAAANIRMGHKNQYFYVFNHTSVHTSLPYGVTGSVHMGELPYVFGAPLVGELGVFSGNWTKQDREVSEAMLTFFANFAKAGNPNIRHDQNQVTSSRESNLVRSITWDKYDPVHQKYLAVGGYPKAHHHYRAQPLALWTWLVPRLQRVGRLEFLSLRDPEGREDTDPEEALQELSVVHHLFSRYDDPTLYSGAVRALRHMAGHYVVPSTTSTTTPATTALSGTATPSLLSLLTTTRGPHSGFRRPAPEGGAKPTAHAEEARTEEVSVMPYSTALSVTITIGVSLLILNLLIFAGVYYQRDRIRMRDKQEQQSQQGSLAGSEQQMTNLSPPTTTTTLEVPKSLLAAPTSLMAPPPSPSPILTHTQALTHISECPEAFADPPCGDVDCRWTPVTLATKPNGSATLVGSHPHPLPQHQPCVQPLPQQQYQQQHHHQLQQQQQQTTLPRPPPPPRLVPAESQPLLPVHVPAPPRGKIPPYDELRL